MANLEKMLNDRDEKLKEIELVAQKSKEEVYAQYSPAAFVKTLIGDLNSDYKTIKEKEKNSGQSELKTVMSKLTPKEKEVVLSIADDEKRKKLETYFSPMEVTTYITSDNGNGSCYILTPIKEEDKKSKFNNEFRDWFEGLMNKKTILNEDDSPILFGVAEGDKLNSKGFLTFKVTPLNSKNKDFTEAFIKRLNHFKQDSRNEKVYDIQPAFCKENNIINVAKHLDFEIFKNFIEYLPTNKMGRPAGSKNKKNIEDDVHGNDNLDFAHLNNMGAGQGAGAGSAKSPEYDQFKSKYDSLTEKYGHPPTRSELGWNQRDLYSQMKSAEAVYGKFDFIPQLKGGRKGPRKTKKDNE